VYHRNVFERLFPITITRTQSACLQGDAACDTVKPRPDGILRPQVAGPSREDEEHRLEGVLGILLVPENSATYPQHKWSVTIDKLPECRLTPVEVRGE
jgi:hypothetical protein